MIDFRSHVWPWGGAFVPGARTPEDRSMSVSWVSQLCFSKVKPFCFPTFLKPLEEFTQIFNRVKSGFFTGVSDCDVSKGNGIGCGRRFWPKSRASGLGRQAVGMGEGGPAWEREGSGTLFGAIGSHRMIVSKRG